MTATAAAGREANGAKGRPNGFDSDLGARLRALRVERGITQQEVAAALGISYQQVHKYESGGNRIPSQRLGVIAQVLEVSLVRLLGRDAAAAPAPDRRERLALEVAKAFRELEEYEQQAVARLVNGLVAGSRFAASGRKP